MSTILFVCQWTLQKSGLRLPFIGWSAYFTNSSLLFSTAQWAIKQPFWALCIVVYNRFKIWANTCDCWKTLKENLLRLNIHPITHHWANKWPTWSLHSFNCNESLSEWKAHFIGGPKSQTAITSLSARQKNKMHFLNFKWDLNELEVSESTNHLR